MMIIPYTPDLSCKKFLRKQNFKIKYQRYPISLMIDIHNQFFLLQNSLPEVEVQLAQQTSAQSNHYNL